MKFPLGCKLHSIAASEDGRYAMDCIKIDTKSDRAPAFVATDGRSLAVIPVELEEGESMPEPPEGMSELLLPVDAMKAAASMKTGLHQHYVSIRIEGDQVVLRNGLGAKQSFSLLSADRLFPSYTAHIPPPEGRVRVQFDARYLYNLMCALRDSRRGNGIVLSIDPKDSDSPILVEVGNGVSVTWEDVARSVVDTLPDGSTRTRNPVGVLMPIKGT